MITQRPDVDRVLAGLKDFQRRSVDYVFERLYGDHDPVRRFLVADEVGLGKTMVAKGVIAKAMDHLWETTDRIDIIYICSNGAIAKQNIKKLDIVEGSHTPLATRITMLPEKIGNLSRNKTNFVSFTPSTSFNLKSSLGKFEERGLLYSLLKGPWEFHGHRAANVLQGYADSDGFREYVAWYDDECVEASVRQAFETTLSAREAERKATGKRTWREEFEELCEHYPTKLSKPDKDISRERSRFVGDLRALLAAVCMESLEPDLIILDEFQRFKHLLDEDSEESALARELFNYTDERSHARVLLLSATPYKMYTIDGEAGGDDHCEDFLATLRFLQRDPSRTEATGDLLRGIRRSMLAAPSGGAGDLEALTTQLQRELSRVMIRTERLAVSPDRDGMLEVPACKCADVTSQDIRDYVALAGIADLIDHHEPIEYWKSAPYLLNFMEQYAFRKGFDQERADLASRKELFAAVAASGKLFLDWEAIERYEELDPANARLRWLLDRVVKSGAWRLLWLPPSAPSYTPGGAFADSSLAGFSKTLIFSSWQVVPRAIAAMVSYEVERRIATASEDNPAHTRTGGGDLLRADADSTNTLLYPSVTLATLAERVTSSVRERTADPLPEAVLGQLEEAIAPMVAGLVAAEQLGGEVDEAWYWAAPLLLDAAAKVPETVQWLESAANVWGTTDEESDEGSTGPAAVARLARMRDIVESSGRTLGRQPGDLSAVLARIALGSPAVSALRAMGTIAGGVDSYRSRSTRTAAARLAWGFRNLFNGPEATGIVRGRSRDPYWRLVLDYGIDGCLSDVLAEYAHVLASWRGVDDKPVEERLAVLAEVMGEAMGLRTATLRIDAVGAADHEPGSKPAKRSMRARFAARLAADEDELNQEKGTDRLDRLSKAFNSPFWPFVLASTSIGQEGLDFHLYCHAVAHWNLPSNPVDLEQREGRVHRFKGHAVRKNLASAHGGAATAPGSDRWEAMFQAAVTARDPSVGDVVPFWVFTVPGGATIERHVPMLPMSRDRVRYQLLCQSLAMYRMVFGQPRQEDLLGYLRKHVPEDQIDDIRRKLVIDLSPPVAGAKERAG